jgi:hypothetical protein
MISSLKSALRDLAHIPDTDRPVWLESARASVDFLKKNLLNDDEILLYASGPHFWVHSVLAPNAAVSPPDHGDLSNAYLTSDDSWRIQRSYGGGEGHRVYLEPPLSHPGCKSLIGGERLFFIRSFEGMKNYEAPIEISQKLVHSLGVHFVDERHTYCRLDNKGDLEDVICVHIEKSHDPWKAIQAISIRRHDLATYLALSATSLVARFDFTRFVPSGFSSWDGADEQQVEAKDLYYRHRVLPGYASYAHGHIVLRTTLTVDDLVEQWKAEDDEKNKKYASFKIIDRKNDNKFIETSCGPDSIVNYFKVRSPLGSVARILSCRGSAEVQG